MAKEVVLTYDGQQELLEELEELKTVGRKDVAEKIKTALSFGDLSENSEYDEAKSDQGKLETRIIEIEEVLTNATILDEDNLSIDVVRLGTRIKVRDIEYDEVLSYQIVGFAQAAPDDGKLSDESPVGAALIGHKVGDTVHAQAPAGIISFEVLEISK